MAKWTKAQHAKYAATLKRKAANAFPPVPEKPEGGVIVDGQYIGEKASVDVNRIEDRAFRRGLFTGLQMVVDLLIRELR